jgi:hypothetical protein
MPLRPAMPSSTAARVVLRMPSPQPFFLLHFDFRRAAGLDGGDGKPN